jgi:hypothetical protein
LRHRHQHQRQRGGDFHRRLDGTDTRNRRMTERAGCFDDHTSRRTTMAPRPSTIDLARVETLRRDGLTWEQISQRLGVVPAQLHKLRKRARGDAGLETLKPVEAAP